MNFTHRVSTANPIEPGPSLWTRTRNSSDNRGGAPKACCRVSIVPFSNVYDDADRAKASAKLEFPGTYYLAFRDLPAIVAAHVTGREALDFGCGAGRSTRFLKSLGFDATGIDISSSMIDLARNADPAGAYRLVEEGGLSAFKAARFDVVLSAFAFDNIPGVDNRCVLLQSLARLLKSEGRIILLGSTPDIYIHEWASFTTIDFPENRHARSGATVRIVMKDVEDQRPVVDLIWFHDDYLNLFAASGLDLVARYTPLGNLNEPYAWLTETSIAPWVIYVLKPTGTNGSECS
jgi:ubiquinone/menaquinone biosynthesis C-methylase UbiE